MKHHTEIVCKIIQKKNYHKFLKMKKLHQTFSKKIHQTQSWNILHQIFIFKKLHHIQKN